MAFACKEERCRYDVASTIHVGTSGMSIAYDKLRFRQLWSKRFFFFPFFFLLLERVIFSRVSFSLVSRLNRAKRFLTCTQRKILSRTVTYDRRILVISFKETPLTVTNTFHIYIMQSLNHFVPCTILRLYANTWNCAKFKAHLDRSINPRIFHCFVPCVCSTEDKYKSFKSCMLSFTAFRISCRVAL